jgi:hypothetical protein
MNRIFIDMDGVIVDFDGYARSLDRSGDETKRQLGAYLRMEPMPGAIEAIRSLIDSLRAESHNSLALACPRINRRGTPRGRGCGRFGDPFPRPLRLVSTLGAIRLSEMPFPPRGYLNPHALQNKLICQSSQCLMRRLACSLIRTAESFDETTAPIRPSAIR